jgi:hypothetical protein
MAILKMGALVTEIIGSLGGMAFKKQRGTQVMMKKSNGASRSSVLQNKRLGEKAQIFQSWGGLSPVIKEEWNFQATKFKFPNKFGNDVNLTGIQLQRKLQIQNSVYSSAVIEPSTIDKTLKNFTISDAEINWGASSFGVRINTVPTGVIIAFLIEFSQSNLNEPIYSRRGVFYCDVVPDMVKIELFSELIAKYPFLNDKYNLRLYAYEINPHGFVSAQIFKNVTPV